MNTASEPEFVAQTLAWCNERRAENDKEPLDRLPKGRRKDSASCPCGSVTGLIVGPLNYVRRDGGDAGLDLPAVDLPAPVQQFVRAFDDGELPQYDEEVAA